MSVYLHNKAQEKIKAKYPNGITDEQAIRELAEAFGE